MKTRSIIIGILILIEVILAIVSFKYFSNYIACTKKLCHCSENFAQIKCNDCSYPKEIWIGGIFNIVKTCSAKEVILCDGTNQIDTSYDIDSSSCKNKFFLFVLPVYG